MQLVRERNELDFQLYRFARELFAAQLSRQDRFFGLEVSFLPSPAASVSVQLKEKRRRFFAALGRLRKESQAKRSFLDSERESASGNDGPTA